MKFNSVSEICFSDACLVFILSGIFCAVIRWLHVCHPYGRHADFYYPARRQTTFFFAAIALQFPYVLSPVDSATWIYIRAFGVLYYPACFAMLFRRYFDRHRLYNNWNGFVYIAIPFSAIIVLGIVSQLAGGWLVAYSSEVYIISGVVGFLLMVYFISVAHRLKLKIDKFHYDNFSCKRDFPFLFAKRVVYTPLIWLAAMWIIFISGSHWFMFFVDIIFAACMVLFLAVILHPQRAREVRRNLKIAVITEIPPVSETDNTGEECIRREIVAIVGKMYRNSGLQKQEVVDMVEYGRKTQAKSYLTKVGYYNFVNAFRLEHARLYKEANPKATLDEVAEAAGFRDRFALINAKKRERETDCQLTDGFHFEI